MKRRELVPQANLPYTIVPEVFLFGCGATQLPSILDEKYALVRWIHREHF